LQNRDLRIANEIAATDIRIANCVRTTTENTVTAWRSVLEARFDGPRERSKNSNIYPLLGLGSIQEFCRQYLYPTDHHQAIAVGELFRDAHIQLPALCEAFKVNNKTNFIKMLKECNFNPFLSAMVYNKLLEIYEAISPQPLLLP